MYGATGMDLGQHGSMIKNVDPFDFRRPGAVPLVVR